MAFQLANLDAYSNLGTQMGVHETRISAQLDVTNQGHVTSVTQDTCS